MKIIENNYKQEKTIERIVCDNCNSVFEINEDDINIDRFEDRYVCCPCCNNKVWIDYVTKDNIEFPKHFSCFKNGVDIKDNTINNWIKDSIKWLEENPNEPYRYIGTGNSIMIIFNHNDEYYIVVAKNYFDVTIDK